MNEPWYSVKGGSFGSAPDPLFLGSGPLCLLDIWRRISVSAAQRSGKVTLAERKSWRIVVTSRMPFCTQCGNQVQPSDTFCAKCGTRQAIGAPPAGGGFSAEYLARTASMLCISRPGMDPAVIVLASPRFRGTECPVSCVPGTLTVRRLVDR